MGQAESALGSIIQGDPFPWIADDDEHRISMRDAEERFNRLTSNGSQALSLGDLQKVLGEDEDGALDDKDMKDIFQQLDTDGDGKISRDEFVKGLLSKSSTEVVDGTASLLKSSGMVEEVATLLIEQVNARMHPNGGEEEMKLSTLLSEVKTSDFAKAYRDAEEAVVREFEVKLHALRETKQNFTETVREFNAKYAYDASSFEGLYKDMADFRAGVEGSLGLPGKDIYDGIKMEFCHSDDSKDTFVTSNYGGTATTPALEYEFVVNPRMDFDYGGGRSPVPLEILLFAASAKKQNTDMEAYDTPLEELEEETRDGVKTVLFRRVREAGFTKPFLAATKDPKLRKLKKMSRQRLSKIQKDVGEVLKTLPIQQKTGQPSYNELKTALEEKCNLNDDEIEALVKHMRQKLGEAKLTEEELIALRLYSGPAFMKLNSTLRDTDTDRKGNNYVCCIFAAISGMVKLAEISPIPEGRMVYRGQRGMYLPASFKKGNAQGVKGGVEMAFVSTTTDLQVAIDYAKDGNTPIVFAIAVGAVDKGAALGFLSQYPNEEEILMPPRSFLEVVGDPSVIATALGPVLQIPVKINCNLQCPTLEKLRESRRTMLVSALEHVRKEIVRDVDAAFETEEVKDRVKHDIFWENHGTLNGKQFVDSLKGEGSKVLAEVKERTAKYYREDIHFRRAMQQALDVHRKAMGKLQLWVEERSLYVTHLNDMSAQDCDRKAAGRLRRLIEEAEERCEEEEGREEARRELQTLAGRLCRHMELIHEDVNAPLHEGETALMKYGAEGNEEAVRLLLQARADPEVMREDGMTALMFAAQCGQEGIVKRLVKTGGANPNARSDRMDGRTALLFAAENGHTRTASALVTECAADVQLTQYSTGLGPAHRAAYFGFLSTLQVLVGAGSADVNAQDAEGWTALMLAAQNGHAKVVAWLVHEGKADVNAKTKSEQTALTAAVHNGHEGIVALLIKAKPDDVVSSLRVAAKEGRKALVELLVTEGRADVNAVDPAERTPCMLAAMHGQGDVVRWLATEAKANVDREDEDGDTCLIMAAQDGAESMVSCLLETGRVKVDWKNRKGWSSLAFAAQRGHVGVVEKLVAARANVNTSTATGWTPLHAAAANNKLEVVKFLVSSTDVDVEARNHEGWTALIAAVHRQHLDMVSLLLVEAKANVNARDERSGHTALMEAASTGAQALVECLIKEGADFNLAKTSDGETALMLAARGGRHGVVATLVDESTIDLNLQNCCGETALMIASKRGYKSVVEELLSAGALASVADRFSFTAIDAAAYGGHDDIISIFEEKYLLLAGKANNLEEANQFHWTAAHFAVLGKHEELASKLVAIEMGTQDSEFVNMRLAFVKGDVECYLESPVAVYIGAPWEAWVDEESRTVEFLNHPNSYNITTVRFSHSCLRPRKAYYELRIVEPVSGAQFGFVTSRFLPHPSDGNGVGDDEESWAVDGCRGQKFHGAAVEYESPKWQQGDVIGLACDLEKGEILVSVNGNFSPAVFQMDPSEIPDEMHAAFSAQSGIVEYSFEEEDFAYPPPRGFEAIAMVGEMTYERPSSRATVSSETSSSSPSHGSSSLQTPVRRGRSFRGFLRASGRPRFGSSDEASEAEEESVERWLSLKAVGTSAGGIPSPLSQASALATQQSGSTLTPLGSREGASQPCRLPPSPSPPPSPSLPAVSMTSPGSRPQIPPLPLDRLVSDPDVVIYL